MITDIEEIFWDFQEIQQANKETLFSFFIDGLKFKICANFGCNPKFLGTIGKVEIWNCARCGGLCDKPSSKGELK